MLNPTSIQFGQNLAMILLDRNKDITPVSGTLLSEISSAVQVPQDNCQMENMLSSIEIAAQGPTMVRNNQSNYCQSSHDTLMDNYVADLSKLVSQHVVFARSVVYRDLVAFHEKYAEAVGNQRPRAAEDFFRITYFKPMDVFRSQLLDDEVTPLYGNRVSFETCNLSDAVDQSFDLLGYILTGDDGQDEMIRAWFNATGKEKLFGYLLPSSGSLELSLAICDALDFHLINFLFYRSLVIKQDLKLPLTMLQLITKATVNRDYFATQLANTLASYKSVITNGNLLSSNSNVRFSYLTNEEFPITIYEEVFNKAAEDGLTLEHIFGYISKFGRSDVTASTLKAREQECLSAWSTTRGLYITYFTSNRSNLLRMTLNMAVADYLSACETNDNKDLIDLTPQGKEATNKLINEYIDGLSASEIEDSMKVCTYLIANIIFRHTNAAFFINEITELTKADEKLSMRDAALLATVKYVTDFLVEQLDIA